MSFLNDSKIDIAPSDKPKRISNLLKTDKLLSTIRALPEIGHFRIGCALFCTTFGLLGYYFYRKQYEQSIVASEYHYKLTRRDAVDVNKQFFDVGAIDEPTRSISWLSRVPEKEFNVIYRMKPAIITGQFDHNKEILFPRVKDGRFGYDVITPFYYYLKFHLDNNNGVKDSSGKIVLAEEIERAALAVNRGWYIFFI
jgi:hypothetical protein